MYTTIKYILLFCREDTGHTSTSGHQGEPESETKRMPSQSPQKQSTPTHAGSKVRQIRHRRSVTNVANRERRSTSNEQTTPVSAAVHEVSEIYLRHGVYLSISSLSEPFFKIYSMLPICEPPF